MSNLDKLLAKGAEVCAGSVILRHKELGTVRNGEFYINADGLAELAIEDVVEVKEIKKPAKAKAKADEVPAAEGDVTIDVE